MKLINAIDIILRDKKEKKFLWIIIFGIIITTILETFSIASIIPVFNAIIFEKIPENNLSFLKNFTLNQNTKVIILFIFLFIFIFKNLFIVFFNYFFIFFLKRISTTISNRLFSLFVLMRYRLYRTDYRIWQETKPPPKMSGSGS